MSRNLVSRNLQPIFSTELRRHVAWQELFASTYGTMVGIRKRGSRNRDGKDLMILAIIHDKGGVGKTTSAVSLAAGLDAETDPNDTLQAFMMKRRNAVKLHLGCWLVTVGLLCGLPVAPWAQTPPAEPKPLKELEVGRVLPAASEIGKFVHATAVYVPSSLGSYIQYTLFFEDDKGTIRMVDVHPYSRELPPISSVMTVIKRKP